MTLVNIPQNPDPAGLNPPTTGNIVHCQVVNGEVGIVGYMTLSSHPNFYDDWPDIASYDGEQMFFTLPSEDFGSFQGARTRYWGNVLDREIIREAFQEAVDSPPPPERVRNMFRSSDSNTGGFE